MLKKVLYIMVISLFSLTLLTACETCEHQVFSSDYQANVDESIKMSQNLQQLYITGEAEDKYGSYTTYKKNYAGSFIDDTGILNIGLVGDLPKTSAYPGKIVYKKMTYSLNYLTKVMREIENLDYPKTSNWILSIDEQLNCVIMEINNYEDVDRIVKHLKSKKLLKRYAVRFYVDLNMDVDDLEH
ncbi:MAG: hypothetical protein ACOX56_04365 [Acholeplasmataceae bacterium]